MSWSVRLWRANNFFGDRVVLILGRILEHVVLRRVASFDFVLRRAAYQVNGIDVGFLLTEGRKGKKREDSYQHPAYTIVT